MELQTYTFGGKSPVRIVDRQGEPWWVAKDVCGALGLEETHKAVARLDADDRIRIPVIDAKGRPQPTTIVSEAGLYALVLRSDKPEAKAFKRWITHEVLPAIRRTGRYESPGLQPSQGIRKAAKVLGIGYGTLQNRVRLHPELIPLVRAGDLVALRRYFQAHPLQMHKSRRKATTPAPALPAQALLQLLAELKQLYTPAQTQQVLHNLDPKTFPPPQVQR